MWPFANGIRAGAAAVMCGYNQVNNSQSCQNVYLLNYLHKGELGFQGFVVSDWYGTYSGVSTILAGLDMTIPGYVEPQDMKTGRGWFGDNLTIAVLNGPVPEWRLNDAATRIVAAWYYLGRDNATEEVSYSAYTKKRMVLCIIELARTQHRTFLDLMAALKEPAPMVLWLPGSVLVLRTTAI